MFVKSTYSMTNVIFFPLYFLLFGRLRLQTCCSSKMKGWVAWHPWFLEKKMNKIDLSKYKREPIWLWNQNKKQGKTKACNTLINLSCKWVNMLIIKQLTTKTRYLFVLSYCWVCSCCTARFVIDQKCYKIIYFWRYFITNKDIL